MTTLAPSVTSVTSWSELSEHLETYLRDSAQWVFRGHGDKDWPLTTRIERLRDLFGTEWNEMPAYEWKLLREFHRRAHNYLSNPPSKDDYLGWLALMRHHGGPTRLLDFTYSPFVATYFALETAPKETDSAVWAINYRWVDDAASRIVKKASSAYRSAYETFKKKRNGESFKTIFWEDPPRAFVSAANPKRLNERLTLQQGTFLCPSDITQSFEKNLEGAPGLTENLHRIDIGHSCRTEFLARLRKMNIDSTSLFPGLDGFAQSLNSRFDEIGKMLVVGGQYEF